MATLTVVGGLPAVGKTAVCREILRLRAEAQPQSRPPTWLRIDTIEQALRDSGEMLPGMPGGAGYYVAAAVARDVLAAGGEVLVECVNPLPLTRRLWEKTASALDCRFSRRRAHLLRCGRAPPPCPAAGRRYRGPQAAGLEGDHSP